MSLISKLIQSKLWLSRILYLFHYYMRLNLSNSLINTSFHGIYIHHHKTNILIRLNFPLLATVLWLCRFLILEDTCSAKWCYITVTRLYIYYYIGYNPFTPHSYPSLPPDYSILSSLHLLYMSSTLIVIYILRISSKYFSPNTITKEFNIP